MRMIIFFQYHFFLGIVALIPAQFPFTYGLALGSALAGVFSLTYDLLDYLHHCYLIRYKGGYHGKNN